MDVRQLRYFAAIIEQGSFTRAAAALNVAQPALSLHVRNMENELGTALLFRSPKGVAPTEAGAILLKHAQIILDQFTAAEEEIRGHQREPEGEVRLGLPGTISEILSVPLITEVHRRYPKIRLRIAEAMSGFVLEWMRSARIDLAVTYRDVSDEGLASIRLLEEELVFFGQAAGLPAPGLPAPGGSVTLEQVAHMPLIVPSEAHGLRELLDARARMAGITYAIAMEVDAYSNIKGLVANGFGHSIMPLNAIRRELAEGNLHHWRVETPPLQRSVHLAWPVKRPMTNATAAVLGQVRAVLNDLVRTGGWVGATLARQETD